ATPAYLIVILFAGLTLGDRGGFITGMVCCLTALALVLAETMGYLPKTAVHPSLFTIWVGGVIIAAIAMRLQNFAARTIEETLQRAGRELEQREKALKALGESEARVLALFEGAPDAIVVSGADGNILMANEQAEHLFGYSREELAGQSIE